MRKIKNLLIDILIAYYNVFNLKNFSIHFDQFIIFTKILIINFIYSIILKFIYLVIHLQFTFNYKIFIYLTN